MLIRQPVVRTKECRRFDRRGDAGIGFPGNYKAANGGKLKAQVEYPQVQANRLALPPVR